MTTGFAAEVLNHIEAETSRIGSWVARPQPLAAFMTPQRQRSRVGELIGTVAEKLETFLYIGWSQPTDDPSPLAGQEFLTGESPRASNAASLDRARRVIRKITESQPGRCWRYRHLVEATHQHLDRFSVTKSCWIHLNPARCWAVLHPTNPTMGSHRLPLNTLIYEFAGLQGLVADLEGQVLINELADYQPCSIAEWSRLSSLASISQLTALVRRLASCGLVALA